MNIPSHYLEISTDSGRSEEVPANTLTLVHDHCGPAGIAVTTTSATVDAVRAVVASGVSTPAVALIDHRRSYLPLDNAIVQESISVVIPTTLSNPHDTVALVRQLAVTPEVESVLVVPNGAVAGVVAAFRRAFENVEQVEVLSGTQASGVSEARNSGVEAAESEWVAILDDDIALSPNFGASIAGSIARTAWLSAPTAVISGLVLSTPQTDVQLWFESAGGFRKGFDYQVFSPQSDALTALQSTTRMGTGAVMIVNRNWYLNTGGMCPTLGPGSPARFGGEDLELLFTAVTTGHNVIYDPQIWVRHPAQPTWEDLYEQTYRYGAGLSLLVTHLLATGALSGRDLARAIPRAATTVAKRDGYVSSVDIKFPTGMKLRELAGLLRGSVAYWRNPRAARQASISRHRSHCNGHQTTSSGSPTNSMIGPAK